MLLVLLLRFLVDARRVDVLAVVDWDDIAFGGTRIHDVRVLAPRLNLIVTVTVRCIWHLLVVIQVVVVCTAAVQLRIVIVWHVTALRHLSIQI